MKAWQFGYELDYLKKLESKYSEYNKFALSPFAEVKKNNIAEMLHKNNLRILGDEDAFFEISEVKIGTPISMHGKTILALRQRGDVVLAKLAGSKELIKNEFDKIKEKNLWLYIWAESEEDNRFARECDFKKVGPKITSFGEIYNVYYRGEERNFPKINPAEFLSIKKVFDVDREIVDKIRGKVSFLPLFTNHYSNYNKGKSWSALSLRGYSDDPSFITKPSEMNDKWLKEHEDDNFQLQDTYLYKDFPEIKKLLEQFDDTEIHRVRFMKLSSLKGELQRHTDQVDVDSGGSVGKLARLHFPIITNEKVVFTVWGCEGQEQCVNMKEGECWFLDTRKPHKAINGGSEDRIHLVVDVLVNERIQELLCAA